MNKALVLFAAVQAGLWAQASKDLSRDIFEIMSHAPGAQAETHRVVHAKGMVATGTFTPSAAAKDLSRAAHFAAPVPVTVRFSDGASDPMTLDNSDDANPRGIAIRFTPASGGSTDIVAISHNGFLVGTGEDFLELLKAKAATDPSKPHPWPIEAFLGSHPNALKFVTDPKPMPQSFTTEAYYGNNAFTLINKDGAKQVGRFQILPAEGAKYLDDAAAKATAANFLEEELKTRLAKGPAKFKLVLQLPGAGDKTNDGSIVWPSDRKTVEMGEISLIALVADSAAVEKTLAFSPTRLIDGIALSDDPLPGIRARVYAIAAAKRHAH